MENGRATIQCHAYYSSSLSPLLGSLSRVPSVVDNEDNGKQEDWYTVPCDWSAMVLCTSLPVFHHFVDPRRTEYGAAELMQYRTSCGRQRRKRTPTNYTQVLSNKSLLRPLLRIA